MNEKLDERWHKAVENIFLLLMFFEAIHNKPDLKEKFLKHLEKHKLL